MATQESWLEPLRQLHHPSLPLLLVVRTVDVPVEVNDYVHSASTARSRAIYRVLGILVHFARARDASELSCEVELVAVAAPPVEVVVDISRTEHACRVGRLRGRALRLTSLLCTIAIQGLLAAAAAARRRARPALQSALNLLHLVQPGRRGQAAPLAR
eukprot:scaffold118860_cov63-Phaeocystis_antarctica.AAC.5